MKMNFCRVMRQLALRHAERPAIVNVERGRRYSHLQFHLLTNRIANALHDALRLRAGDHFMLILENDNLSLMHMPTAFKQAATVVFTNHRDSLEEHTWQVDLVKPKVVFLESDLVDKYHAMLRERGCTIVAMDPLPPAAAAREGVLDFWTLVDAASDADNAIELDVHQHIAMLRFTGGTTGKGKCAMYSIDNMLGNRDSAYANPDFGFTRDTRFLHFAPLSHGTLLLYLPTLFMGGCTLTQNLPDLERWLRTVEAERVSHSFLVPTLLYRLLDLQAAQARDLSSLSTILYGAAPMNPTRLADLVKCFGSIFVQGYAATEVPMFIAALDKALHDSGDARLLASAGRVTPGVEVYIADDEGRELAQGATGEIRIRGRSVIKGYFRNEEGSAAEFANGAWKSGDIGYIDAQGFLYIVDRKKDMIITGGFNVYAVEVEAALGSHPAVQMCAVVGIPHAEWGEAVHAEVMLRPGASATAQELIAHARQTLGSYKAPKSVDFVAQLPVSVVGKVLRRIVKDKYWKNQGRNVG